MPERVTRVTLRAVNAEFIEGMRRAADETMRTGTAMERLAQQRQSLETLGRTAVGAGLALGAGVAVAVARAAEFEQAMSQVNAVTQETAENQSLLRDAALEAGGATIYTAREAAQAEEELAKAGLTTSNILSGALTGSLNLAASGQLEVSRAAEITGITLKQFALDGSQASRVADVLSAGANKAVGSVDDLANALKFAGPIAASLGASIEDTTATLAFFADQGIVGEQAGTALRGMLASLQAPSNLAQKALDELGISIYDNQGRFIGMRSVVEQLETALRGKTQAERDAALGIIFTNAQLTTAQVLVGAGADKWQEYRDAVDDSGIAARIAEDRMDNLAGDVEKLGGAFDTALIKGGSAATGVLRGLVQSTTEYIDSFADLPDWVQGSALVVAGLTAAVSLGGGAFLLAVPKIAAYRAALETMSPTVQRAGRALEGATRAVGLFAAAVAAGQVASGIDGWVKDISGATKTTEAFTLALKEGTDAADLVNDTLSKTGELGDLFGGTGANSIKQLTGGLSGLASVMADIQDIDWLTGLANITGLGLYDTSLKTTRDNLRQLDGALAQMVASGNGERAAEVWRELVKQTDGSKESIDKLRELFPQYAEAQLDAKTGAQDFAAAQTEAQEATEAFSDAMSETAAAFVDSLGAYDAVVAKNTELAQSTADATDSAEDSWEDYYDGVSVSVADYLAELQRQVDAQNQWEENMTALAGRVSQETLDELARMGPEGAPLVAALVDASDDELTKLESLFAEKSKGAVDSFAGNLISLQAQIDKFFDRNTGRSLSWGGRIVLPDGSRINPGMFADGGMVNHRVIPNADGAMYSEGIYTGGAPLYKFAEPETGWEAFVSGRPGKERENFGYALESMMRLSHQMGLSVGSPAPAPSQVDQSVHAPITVRSEDPFVAAELVSQRLGSYLATRR